MQLLGSCHTRTRTDTDTRDTMHRKIDTSLHRIEDVLNMRAIVVSKGCQPTDELQAQGADLDRAYLCLTSDLIVANSCLVCSLYLIAFIHRQAI